MKKEKHPVYYAVLAAFLVLLAVGVTLLICALSVGDPPFLLSPPKTI